MAPSKDTPRDTPSNGIGKEYRDLVLDSIKDVKEDIREHRAESKEAAAARIRFELKVTEEIATLRAEVKNTAKYWGAIAGFVTTIITAALAVLGISKGG